jgi:hypothetical protein
MANKRQKKKYRTGVDLLSKKKKGFSGKASVKQVKVSNNVSVDTAAIKKVSSFGYKAGVKGTKKAYKQAKKTFRKAKKTFRKAEKAIKNYPENRRKKLEKQKKAREAEANAIIREKKRKDNYAKRLQNAKPLSEDDDIKTLQARTRRQRKKEEKARLAEEEKRRKEEEQRKKELGIDEQPAETTPQAETTTEPEVEAKAKQPLTLEQIAEMKFRVERRKQDLIDKEKAKLIDEGDLVYKWVIDLINSVGSGGAWQLHRHLQEEIEQYGRTHVMIAIASAPEYFKEQCSICIYQSDEPEKSAQAADKIDQLISGTIPDEVAQKRANDLLESTEMWDDEL